MKFEVGETAILWCPDAFRIRDEARAIYGDLHGMEVEISALPGPSTCPHCGKLRRDSEIKYSVIMPDGRCAGAYEQYLRKKRPPIPDEVLRIFEREPANA